MTKQNSSSEKLHLNSYSTIYEHAKHLRKNPTKAENLLWQYLRGKRLLGIKFRRQHPLGTYIADFYSHKLQLVIECDGLVHNDKEQNIYDQLRTSALERAGITVIRFKNEEIIHDIQSVLMKIVTAVTLTPRPPLLKERGRKGERV